MNYTLYIQPRHRAAPGRRPLHIAQGSVLAGEEARPCAVLGPGVGVGEVGAPVLPVLARNLPVSVAVDARDEQLDHELDRLGQRPPLVGLLHAPVQLVALVELDNAVVALRGPEHIEEARAVLDDYAGVQLELRKIPEGRKRLEDRDSTERFQKVYERHLHQLVAPVHLVRDEALRVDDAEVALALGEASVKHGRVLHQPPPLDERHLLRLGGRSIVLVARGVAAVDLFERAPVLEDCDLGRLAVELIVAEAVVVVVRERRDIWQDVDGDELVQCLAHVGGEPGLDVLGDGDAHDHLQPLVTEQRAIEAEGEGALVLGRARAHEDGDQIGLAAVCCGGVGDVAVVEELRPLLHPEHVVVVRLARCAVVRVHRVQRLDVRLERVPHLLQFHVEAEQAVVVLARDEPLEPDGPAALPVERKAALEYRGRGGVGERVARLLARACDHPAARGEDGRVDVPRLGLHRGDVPLFQLHRREGHGDER
mmetsp:Transcript_35722/g.89074  ORF Transcript_35722/g.89074 Transcript_35722/m.89074 type:complete len:481 (+) Transcript_35722:31-1473(+)